MNVSEEDRRTLYDGLAEAIGSQPAGVLMELLPRSPSGELVTRTDMHANTTLLRSCCSSFASPDEAHRAMPLSFARSLVLRNAGGHRGRFSRTAIEERYVTDPNARAPRSSSTTPGRATSPSTRRHRPPPEI